MRENKFQKYVIEQLESQAAFVMNFHGHGMQRAGWPDLEVLHTRWDGFLELKCEKYKASALQRVTAAKIELRGTPCYVLRCVETHMDANFTYSEDTEYTLENFQGDVIKTFYDLRKLLDILVGLSKLNIKEN